MAPLRVGLTGGIGSGKSTVAGLLVTHGATLIDTDGIARALTLPGGTAIDAISAAFGADMIDATGAMDRARMRELVFQDRGAKRKLESILHPLIGQACEQEAAAASGPMVVFDVPLLVESTRWRAIVERVLVVDVDEETQVRRVVERSCWTAEAVRAVIAQQAARAHRRAAADAVICNQTLSLSELAGEVDALWQSWAPRAH